MKPNNFFDLNCNRHYQSPLSEKGKWELTADSIILKFDSSTLYFGTVNKDILRRIDTNETKYDALFWSQFISQKSYHDNWTVSIEKTWKYFSRLGAVKHGEWKYYSKLGTLEKIEIYRRDKLRKTIKEPNKS